MSMGETDHTNPSQLASETENTNTVAPVARFYDLDNDYDIASPRNAAISIIGLTVSDRLLCVGEKGTEADIVLNLCHIHRYQDGFWLAPNPDLPTQVNGETISSPVLLSQGSVIIIGDRRMKYSLIVPKSGPRVVGNHIRHGFEPPPKPRRQKHKDQLLSSDPELDLDLLNQTRTPFEVAELAASIVNQQILLHTDTVLSANEIDSIFKSFMEVAKWDQECLRKFIGNYKSHVERTKSLNEKNPLDPGRFHPPVIFVLVDVLHVTMEPVAYNVLWLKLLGVFTHFSYNLPVLVNHRAAAVVLGCMAGHIKDPAVQQHGCDILSQLALYKPAPLEKGPVRESGVELIVRALRTHPLDLLILRPGCRAIANLTTSYATLMSQLLSSVEDESDEILEEPLARVIAVLDYIGDTAYPVCRDIMIGHGSDHIVHAECTRVLAFFMEDHEVPRKMRMPGDKKKRADVTAAERGGSRRVINSLSTTHTANSREDDDGDSSESDAGLTWTDEDEDVVISRTKLQPELLEFPTSDSQSHNAPEYELLEPEHHSPGDEEHKLATAEFDTETVRCVARVEENSMETEIKENRNIEVIKANEESDTVEKCTSKSINKVGQVNDCAQPSGFSEEGFLPTSDGEIGALGKTRVSLARKAGVKGALKQMRKRNPSYDDEESEMSDSENDEHKTSDACVKVGQLSDDLIPIEGTTEQVESEECELSRSMEAMAPSTNSKVKGSYIKSRISQYIQKLKESTRPKWKRKKVNIATEVKPPSEIETVTSGEDEENLDVKERGDTEPEHQMIPVTPDDIDAQSPSQSPHDTHLIVCDSVEESPGALTSGDLDEDQLIEQEIRQNKTSWKRVMEEMKQNVECNETKQRADAQITADSDINEPDHTDNTVSDPTYLSYASSANGDADAKVSNPPNIVEYEDRCTKTPPSLLTTDNQVSTQPDASLKKLVAFSPEKSNRDLAKYDRTDSLETIQEEVIVDKIEPNSLHFVIGVSDTKVVGDYNFEKNEKEENMKYNKDTENELNCFASKTSEDENVNEPMNVAKSGPRIESKIASGNLDGLGNTTSKNPEKDTKAEENERNVNAEMESHRYQPDADIHHIRSDHRFLAAKLSERLKVLQRVKYMFEAEGDAEVTLHQMEFLLRYGETMSGVETEHENDLLLLHKDPALGLDVVALILSRRLSPECVFKVLQQIVEFVEMLDHPSLITYSCQLLLYIIQGPMADDIDGGLGFFTLRRLHKLTSALLRGEDFQAWEGTQQESVSALFSKVDGLITWK